MMIEMDMTTGKIENKAVLNQDEFGAYVDEVLNAEWLPQQAPRLEPRLELHSQAKPSSSEEVDVEEFMRNLYRNQE